MHFALSTKSAEAGVGFSPRLQERVLIHADILIQLKKTEQPFVKQPQNHQHKDNLRESNQTNSEGEQLKRRGYSIKESILKKDVTLTNPDYNEIKKVIQPSSLTVQANGKANNYLHESITGYSDHTKSQEILSLQQQVTALHQQVQEALRREQQLQIDLASARSSSRRNEDPQEILDLRQQIAALQQEVARHNPSIIAQEIRIPAFSNPANYIYQAQEVIADPVLTHNMTNAKEQTIVHIDNLLGNLNSLIVGNRVMIPKRQVRQSLQDLKDALDVPNSNIDWDTFNRVKGQIEGNTNNFDRISATDVDLLGLKQQIAEIENLKAPLQQENARNAFHQLQQNIANLHQQTGRLDGLADNFLNVHVPAFKNIQSSLAPAVKDKVKEIIAKMQNGEFDTLQKQLNSNVPIYGPTLSWLRDQFRSVGLLHVIEQYKDAVDYYMQQIAGLSPDNLTRYAVKDLHLLRHGTARFNTAILNLNNRHIDANINNQAILERILRTSDPLNLNNEARRQFSADIKLLHEQRDNDLAPITDQVRELTGGYLELERAAVMLYTEDNVPPLNN